MEEENIDKIRAESLMDKMLRFREEPDREHEEEKAVSSLRTLCDSVTRRKQGRVGTCCQSIVLQERATNTDPPSLYSGPSEI